MSLSLPVLATWTMAAGPSLLISVSLLKRWGPPRIIMAIMSPWGAAGKYLSLSSFFVWSGDFGSSRPGASLSRRTILPLRFIPLSSSKPTDGSRDAVADEDDGRGHGAFSGAAHAAETAREIEAALEGAALDHTAPVDLDRDRRLGVRGLLHGEFLKVGPLAGSLGRLAAAAAHAKAHRIIGMSPAGLTPHILKSDAAYSAARA